MSIKRLKPDDIVGQFRQIEVLRGQGVRRICAIRQISVTEHLQTQGRILGGQRHSRAHFRPSAIMALAGMSRCV